MFFYSGTYHPGEYLEYGSTETGYANYGEENGYNEFPATYDSEETP